MMKPFLIENVILSIIAILCISCASEVKPPDCGSPETLSMVREIIGKSWNKHNGRGPKNAEKYINFGITRPLDYSRDVQKYSCEAEIVFDSKKIRDIRYDSQLSGNDHIVSVRGINSDFFEDMEAEMYNNQHKN